jgi:hypothetical protein
MRSLTLAALLAWAIAAFASSAKVAAQEPVGGTAEFEAFREAMRAREKVLKSSQVTFRELMYPDVALTSAKAVAGYAQFADGFEKWVRWERVLDDPIDPKSFPSDEFWTSLLQDRGPRIDVADGTRSLSLAPDSKEPGAWRGVLRPAVDRRIRIGALHGTMMFGEQWSSDFLSGYKLSQHRIGPSGSIFTLVPDTKVANTDSIEIHADPDHAPVRLIWRRAEAVVIEAIVLEMVDFEKQRFPARGEMHYSYKPPTTSLVAFRYERSKPGELGPTLLRLPSEISRAGGAVHVIDEQTRAPVAMDDPANTSGRPQDPSKQ